LVSVATGSKEVGLEIADGVAVVTINRPHKRNALTLANWRQLGDIYRRLADGSEARVVILTGAGGHFCAGADISEFDEVRSDVQSGAIYEEATDEATVAIRDWPGPTIAAISGYAMGGGCGLALACDFRVGDDTAKMGIPAARLGIIYGTIDCALLCRQVGLANAKRVLFSGRAFSFDECLQMRLIDVATGGDALTEARTFAAQLAQNAPLTLKGSKFVLEAIDGGREGSVSHEIEELIAEGLASEDYREGRRAFVEKRKPVFTGR
jgi:enoyl-CoA hydratase/carnithine racemase